MDPPAAIRTVTDRTSMMLALIWASFLLFSSKWFISICTTMYPYWAWQTHQLVIWLLLVHCSLSTQCKHSRYKFVAYTICRSVGRCLSVRKVYCGKMAEWIWMLFGVESGVGRGMGVLDGGGYYQKGMDSSGGEFGASHCNQWGLEDFVA